MFCQKCGKKLEDDARFCTYCGALVTADPARPGPAADPAPAPRGNTGASGFDQEPRQPGPRALRKVLIGAAAVVLVAAMAAGLIFSGAFRSDKDRVSEAASRTMSAFSGAARDAGLPDLRSLIESRRYSQSGEIALEDIDLDRYFGIPALKGAGVRFSVNYDLDAEQLSASATPFYGSVDLLTADLVMDGSRVYVNSPELTGRTYYGLDTATLGRDLRELGADGDEVGDLSFNIFQLIKETREITEMDGGDRSAVENAVMELYDAIEVEKTGTETVKVNGGSVKCDAYTVVIPEDAMRDCLGAVRNVVSSSADYRKDLIALFSSMGLPDGMMDDIRYGLSEADPRQSVKTAFSGLEDAVKALGDVELQVYLSGGYIMAVTWSDRIEGARVTAELNLGGGKNYVDDLSLVLSFDGEYSEAEIELTSHGSHSGAGGTFTDETVLEVTVDGETVELSSEMSYAPKKDRNNFSWSIDFEYGRIDMEGRLDTGRDSMELHLDELKLRADDVSVTFRVDYSIGSYQGIPSVKSPVMILTLDEDELRDVVEEIGVNARHWVYGLMNEIPELPFLLIGSGMASYPFR